MYITMEKLNTGKEHEIFNILSNLNSIKFFIAFNFLWRINYATFTELSVAELWTGTKTCTESTLSFH